MDTSGLLLTGADKPYQCNVCFKRFTQKAHLTTHRRTHTGEKPYACHICQKRFAQSSHLNSHKRTHTGEKPYYCVICSLGFCRKQRLEQHLRDVHNEEQTPLSNLSSSEFPSMEGFSSANFTELKSDSVSQVNPVAASHRRKPNVVNRFSIEDLSSVGSSDNAEDGTDKIGKTSQLESPDADMIALPPDSVNFSEPSSCSESKPKKLRKKSIKQEKGDDKEMTFAEGHQDSGDEVDVGDGASVTSESNMSGSEISLSSSPQKTQLFSAMSKNSKLMARYNSLCNKPSSTLLSPSSIGTNSRICLVNFTNEDLFTHMMSRDDVYKCEYCCVIFQDAAMYHLHRSMHDKMDIRCCNMCGKLASDKYDFIAHYLSEHK